jgi:Holliday junction resolvase RusA-like endonuclease
LDKLIRAVLDALTGIAYIDDGQVVEITASKIYSQYAGLKIGIERV